MRLKYFSSYNHCYQQEKHIDSISNTNQHDILQYGELVKKNLMFAIDLIWRWKLQFLLPPNHQIDHPPHVSARYYPQYKLQVRLLIKKRKKTPQNKTTIPPPKKKNKPEKKP